jgi:hypothetical protein
MFFHDVIDTANNLQTVNVDQITHITNLNPSGLAKIYLSNGETIEVKTEVSRQFKDAIRKREEMVG